MWTVSKQYTELLPLWNWQTPPLFVSQLSQAHFPLAGWNVTHFSFSGIWECSKEKVQYCELKSNQKIGQELAGELNSYLNIYRSWVRDRDVRARSLFIMGWEYIRDSVCFEGWYSELQHAWYIYDHLGPSFSVTTWLCVCIRFNLGTAESLCSSGNIYAQWVQHLIQLLM